MADTAQATTEAAVTATAPEKTVAEQAAVMYPEKKADPAKTTTPEPAKAQDVEKPKDEFTVSEPEKKLDDTAEKPTNETPQNQVPEKYELKMPEKSLLEQADLDEVATYAKEKKLSNEQAQALLNEKNQDRAVFHQRLMDKHNQTADAWTDEIKSDPEIGGTKYEESSIFAKKAFDAFAPPGLQKAFAETRLGNHPLLFKWAVRVGRAMSPKTLVSPNANPPKQKAAHDIMYDNTRSN